MPGQRRLPLPTCTATRMNGNAEILANTKHTHAPPKPLQTTVCIKKDQCTFQF